MKLQQRFTQSGEYSPSGCCPQSGPDLGKEEIFKFQPGK